jgi:hypothetical protein
MRVEVARLPWCQSLHSSTPAVKLVRKLPQVRCDVMKLEQAAAMAC